jgi:heme oxygenase
VNAQVIAPADFERQVANQTFRRALLMDDPATTLRARLRVATQPAHSELEASLWVLDEQAPKAVVMNLLGRFYGFHASWEPALKGVVPDHLLYPRLKLPLLDQDLRSLGAGDELLHALPACHAAASLCHNEASAAGSLYVIEGSTLGGRVISRLLSSASWYPPKGLAYWTPYGPETGRRWKETLSYLESLPAAWSDEVIASAHATFCLLQSWLPPGRLPEGESK